jgi:1,4-dihydroxy-2-naphthoate octaprenyltransferase
MGIRTWITGARVRTLPLAVAPILLGSATAATIDRFDLLLSLLAGLVIVLITQQWWLVGIGIFAIIAAWFYTGGKQPYGYHGLGELAVFVFFGLIATIGTNYIQTLIIDPLAVLLGGTFGLYASAVLLVNNIRDIETDSKAGKRTLAVMLRYKPSKTLFLLLIWLPVLINLLLVLFYPATLLGLFNLLLLLPITLIIMESRRSGELITALKLTSFAGLGFAALVSLGIYLVNFF